MIRARIRVDGKLEGDLQALSGAPLAAYRGCGERDGRIGHGKRRSRGHRDGASWRGRSIGRMAGQWQTGAVRLEMEWLAVGEYTHAGPALDADSVRYSSSCRTFSGSGSPPGTVPMRRLNSMKVSRAVRSTALREPSEGGFSALRARPVPVRKSQTALVMLASGWKASCQDRICPAAA